METPPLKKQESAKSKANRDYAKHLKKFKRRFRYLKLASTLAPILHVTASVILLAMSFTGGEANCPVGDGTDDSYMSPTIVVVAFGAVNTCIFAFVETWRVWQGTNHEDTQLPSWNWHNESFMNNVWNVFFSVLFMLPGLVVFMLHSLGCSFFGLLSLQRQVNPDLFGKILFHILSGGAVFIIDMITIIYDTIKLRTFQQVENNDKEMEKLQQEHGVDGGADDDEKKDQVDEDEDIDDDTAQRNEQRQVDNRDRLLAILSLVLHTIFAVDLVVVAENGDPNSGTMGSCIIFLILLAYWYYYTIKHRKLEAVSESWLLNHRMATILHIFCVQLFFWVSLCILLLSQASNGEFFGTLNRLREVREWRAGLCSLLIITFFAHIFDYAVILYVHSRSMWSLDEIASLYLAVQLQEKLRAAE